MAWRQYTYSLTEAEREQVEDALLKSGACAVTLQAATDEPIFEIEPSDRPLWQQIKLSALTEFDLEPETFINSVCTQLETSLIPSKTEIIADKDWTREWMSHFEPIQCGPSLWIVPSWHEPPANDAVNLVLDPGLAFGSGTHPTTKMCLGWLDNNIKPQQTIVDYGCGSGILAIAALLLGAKSAIATDIDAQAIIATKDNAARNHIKPETLNCFVCDEQTIVETTDIVIANILANPLVSLKAELCNLLQTGSQLVLSGILENQANIVIDAYASEISLSIAEKDDGWVLLTGTK